MGESAENALDRAARALDALDTLEELRHAGVEVAVVARPDGAPPYRVVLSLDGRSRAGDGATLAEAVAMAVAAHPV